MAFITGAVMAVVFHVAERTEVGRSVLQTFKNFRFANFMEAGKDIPAISFIIKASVNATGQKEIRGGENDIGGIADSDHRHLNNFIDLGATDVN